MTEYPRTRIFAIDDDPTGSQTVHSCPLLLRWDVETLTRALIDPSPIVFALGNTRAHGAAEARRVNHEICTALREAIARAGNPTVLVVSRSDSTLRGHFPDECDEIDAVLGPFDATFVVPAFLEAGRVTIGGVHYIRDADGALTRADQTPFARDSIFGYSTSFLPGYIEEKSGGRIRADSVSVIPRGLSGDDIAERVRRIERGGYAVVDAESQQDLDRFADVMRRLSERGGHYLFRSAASLLTSFAALPPQPIPPRTYGRLAVGALPGVVVCGSHVPLSTEQLEVLFEREGVAPIEIDAQAIADGRAATIIPEVNGAVAAALAAGRVPAVYTSRAELRDMRPAERLAIGEAISAAIVQIVRALPNGISFLVAKGGITSHVVLKDGLALSEARVSGQIAPACSVVFPPESHRLAGKPVVIFPGNVGDRRTLAEVVAILSCESRG